MIDDTTTYHLMHTRFGQSRYKGMDETERFLARQVTKNQGRQHNEHDYQEAIELYGHEDGVEMYRPKCRQQLRSIGDHIEAMTDAQIKRTKRRLKRLGIRWDDLSDDEKLFEMDKDKDKY